MATERRSKYVADFETTTDPNDCRVWGYGIMNVFNHKSHMIGNDMDSFMQILERLKCDVYFHNLRFDGSFIINWLYRNGFEYSDTPREFTFNTTISKMGQWYKIQIVYDTDSRGRPIHTTIFDSLKKLPFTVKRIAETFKLKSLKGEIDYTKYRPPNHEITPHERKYIYNDIYIMAQALRIQFGNGLLNMTIGSDALKDYKKIINSRTFDNLFPVLSDYVDNDIRRSYKGGFTWLNKKYQNKEIDGGLVFDVNSLYPYVMYDRELPYDVPIYFEGEYEHDPYYPLYIQHIKCEFEIKPDKIPTIQIKQNMYFNSNEYLEHSNNIEVDLYLRNVDLELMKEHYNFKYIIYMSGWKFKSQQGFFNDYIEKWSKVKENSVGGERELAKLMLNNLYGKFATNPDITPKIPKFDGKKIKLVLGDEDKKDPVYTAMGSFITSYARDYTIRTAQKNYERIIYCDTDSIHLEGVDIPENIIEIIDSKKLGYWDHEATFKRGKYLRQKTYIHEFDDGVKVTCAGMPDNIKDKVTFDTFKVGFSSDGLLTPKQVPGGVVLFDSVYTIH